MGVDSSGPGVLVRGALGITPKDCGGGAGAAGGGAGALLPPPSPPESELQVESRALRSQDSIAVAPALSLARTRKLFALWSLLELAAIAVTRIAIAVTVARIAIIASVPVARVTVVTSISIIASIAVVASIAVISSVAVVACIAIVAGIAVIAGITVVTSGAIISSRFPLRSHLEAFLAKFTATTLSKCSLESSSTGEKRELERLESSR